MSRILMAIAILSVAVVATGCATCQNCLDDAPPAYGGICGEGMCGGGRVGSVIVPGGGMILGNEQNQVVPVNESQMPPLEPIPAEPRAETGTLGPG